MPSLEEGDELEAEEQQNDDQERLDRTVEPRGGRIGGGIGGGDSAVGCPDQRDDAAGYGGERGGDLVESEEADEGELAGAARALLLDRLIGGGAADLKAEKSSSAAARGLVRLLVQEQLAVCLSLLVPPFLKLVVRSSRHGQ